jgi:hypothetical protein
MQETKYRDLLTLLFVLDGGESRAKALAEQFPELRTLAEAISDVADLCALAVTENEPLVVPQRDRSRSGEPQRAS